MINSIFVVGGTFDANGGRPSGLVAKIFKNIPSNNVVNGGNLETLERALKRSYSEYINVWMPNVSNDLEKKLTSIKTINKKSILITSKRNFGEYGNLDIISRALSAKANLLLEINRSDGGQFLVRLWDPLGNIWVESADPDIIFSAFYARVLQLTQFTRVQSILNTSLQKSPVPRNIDRFFSVVKEFGERFHTLVHAINQDRFVGNMSFRCEKGFPSFRVNGGFYSSPRNFDKRLVNEECVTFCKGDPNPTNPLEYNGLTPSVDAPIHRYLYQVFPNINYIIHGHVYVANPCYCTAHPIPCGSLEEAFIITNSHIPHDTKLAEINLMGHGFMVMANDIDSFSNTEFVERKIIHRCF